MITLALFFSVFFVRDCYGLIYPINFIFTVILTLVHQLYDLVLKYRDYTIDWKSLPTAAANGLRYNQALF